MTEITDLPDTPKEPTAEEKAAILEMQRLKQIEMIDRTIAVMVGGIELFSNMTFKGSDLRKGADFLDYIQTLKLDLKGQLDGLKEAVRADKKKKPELVEA